MNNDTEYSPADAVSHMNCVFMDNGNCHSCFTDVNCDGKLSPADAVLELNKVFLGQPFPC